MSLILNPPKFVVSADFKKRGKVIDQVREKAWRTHRLLVVWPDGRETTVPQSRCTDLNRDVWLINPYTPSL